MRLALTLSLVCLVAGCDDDTGPGDMSMSDMSAIPADMTGSTADLTNTNQTCLKVAMCASACSDTHCIDGCVAAGTSSAQQKFHDLIDCGFASCLLDDAGMSVDGGPGSCASTTDTSSGCGDCVGAAIQGPACSAQLSACLTDS